MKNRCEWVNLKNELYIKYHDEEWGVPTHDDNKLFEMLILEGAQAGLSWEIVLKKRENYRKAFDNFDSVKVSNYSESKILTLLENEGIIRNRLKIRSAVRNAKVFLSIQKEFGSFDGFIWGYVNGTPIQNNFKSLSDIPAKTELSDRISKDLKKRGMNFVGSTIIYAYLQSIGMVNDHIESCFRHKELFKSNN
jgi:DNA-3-methyladenine glycosylase I